MDLLLALYALGGLLLAGLSVPLVLHKIRPNGFYGFRVPDAQENPQLWYKVNEFAGRRFVIVGLGTSIGAIVLYYIANQSLQSYALGCLGLFVAFFLWGMITSFLHLRTLQAESEK